MEIEAHILRLDSSYVRYLHTKYELLSPTRSGRTGTPPSEIDLVLRTYAPTSDRKYQQIGPNPRRPRMFIFLAHFYFHRNEITLSICGDTSFLPSFLRSNVIFKAISHISGSKKWPKQSVTDRRTDGRRQGRTDRRTSKF